MGKRKISTLSERLDGYQVAHLCSDQIVDMTIGEYFSGYEDKLEEYLSLPSSVNWNLHADAPLSVLTLAAEDESDGSENFISDNSKKAFDLIIYPIVNSDYNLSIFRFTIRGLISFIDETINDEEISFDHQKILKNWKNIIDKSINQTVRYLNECTNVNYKYDWLKYVFAVVFSDEFTYFDYRGKEVNI